jgi:hypothetical protein
MRRISSSMTFFYKRVFPILWFGFLLLFIAGAWLGAKSPPIEFVLIPLAMMGFGYFMMKKLVFDLVDEVLDAGHALVIRNGHHEQRVPLSDITNVSYSQLVNPPRVTLTLRTPGIFGKQVTFCAPVRLWPFAGNPQIDELIERIDAARTSR